MVGVLCLWSSFCHKRGGGIGVFSGMFFCCFVWFFCAGCFVCVLFVGVCSVCIGQKKCADAMEGLHPRGCLNQKVQTGGGRCIEFFIFVFCRSDS